MEIIGKEKKSREEKTSDKTEEAGKIQTSGRIVTSDKIWHGRPRGGGGPASPLRSGLWLT